MARPLEGSDSFRYLMQTKKKKKKSEYGLGIAVAEVSPRTAARKTSGDRGKRNTYQYSRRDALETAQLKAVVTPLHRFSK